VPEEQEKDVGVVLERADWRDALVSVGPEARQRFVADERGRLARGGGGRYREGRSCALGLGGAPALRVVGGGGCLLPIASLRFIINSRLVSAV
jgi:hypothetical protein